MIIKLGINTQSRKSKHMEVALLLEKSKQEHMPSGAGKYRTIILFNR